MPNVLFFPLLGGTLLLVHTKAHVCALNRRALLRLLTGMTGWLTAVGRR